MSILRIIHSTGFFYDGAIRACLAEALMTPASGNHQGLLESEVRKR